jgi:hypothetical protein
MSWSMVGVSGASRKSVPAPCGHRSKWLVHLRQTVLPKPSIIATGKCKRALTKSHSSPPGNVHPFRASQRRWPHLHRPGSKAAKGEPQVQFRKSKKKGRPARLALCCPRRLPPCTGRDPGARPRLDHLIKIEEAALFVRRAPDRLREARSRPPSRMRGPPAA